MDIPCCCLPLTINGTSFIASIRGGAHEEIMMAPWSSPSSNSSFCPGVPSIYRSVSLRSLMGCLPVLLIRWLSKRVYIL
jgi:hypothetical protein